MCSQTPIYLKGRGDTYNLRAANQYLWETVGDASGAVDYAQMEAWWSGLIKLRLSDAGAPLRIGTEVPEGYVLFAAPEAHPQALGWVVDGRIAFAVNGGDAPAALDLGIDRAQWTLVAHSDARGSRVASGAGLPGETHGGMESVPARGVLVWVRD